MSELDEIYPEIFPLNVNRCSVCKYQKLNTNELNIIKQRELNCEIITQAYCKCKLDTLNNSLINNINTSNIIFNIGTKMEVNSKCIESFPCQHNCNGKIMSCIDILSLLYKYGITYENCKTIEQKNLLYHLNIGTKFTTPYRTLEK